MSFRSTSGPELYGKATTQKREEIRTFVRKNTFLALRILSLIQAAESSSTPYILVGDNPIQIENGTLQEYPAAWEPPEAQAFLDGRDSEIQDVSCQGKGVRLVASSDIWPPYFSERLLEAPRWGLEDCYFDIGCELSS